MWQRVEELAAQDQLETPEGQALLAQVESGECPKAESP